MPERKHGLYVTTDRPEHARISKADLLVHQPAELAGAVVASDLGIFKTLAESACSLSVTQIAQRSKADESLVHRFVRLVVAHGMVDQVDTELYAANDITRDYANDYRASNLITM